MVSMAKVEAPPTEVYGGIMRHRHTTWCRGCLGKLNFMLVLLLLSAANNGFDGSMMNGLQTLTNWQTFFNHPHGSVLGVFNAIQSVGVIVGLPFAPFVSDRYGRRWAIFTGSAVVLQTAAQNVAMFIVCRFLIGVGLAFQSVASPVLITELAFPTHRASMTSVYNAFWYVGSLVAAWATFGSFHLNSTWSWRVPSLLQGFVSVLQVTLVWCLPESPRYLIDHDKDEEALHIIAKHHCEGNFDDPLVQFEYQEIKHSLKTQRLYSRVSYLSFFKSRGNLKRLRIIVILGFFSQWAGNGIVSYYLSIALTGIGISSELDQNLINGCLQIWNLMTALTGALLIDRVGRRKLWLTSVGGMLAVYIMWTICAGVYANTGHPAAGHAVLAAFFLYYMFYNTAMSPLLFAYTVEIKGVMFMLFCVYIASIFNQYVNPVALDAIKWKLYIIYTCWLAVEFTVLWFLIVETMSEGDPLPLEEIAKIFDRDEAEVEAPEATASGDIEKK